MQLLSMLPQHYFTAFSAVGGYTAANMLAEAAAKIDPLYSAARARNIILVWVGTNDLLAGSAEDCYSNIATYCQGRKAVGIDPFVFTLNNANGSATWLTRRATLNGLIVANWQTFATKIIRLDLDPHIGDGADVHDTAYYYNDFHLTALGYSIPAGLVAQAMATLANH